MGAIHLTAVGLGVPQLTELVLLAVQAVLADSPVVTTDRDTAVGPLAIRQMVGAASQIGTHHAIRLAVVV